MEQRFNEQLRNHVDDEYAHPKARHKERNTWVERFQLPTEERMKELESRMDNQDGRLRTQENWRMWIMGGLALLAFQIVFLAGAGIALWTSVKHP